MKLKLCLLILFFVVGCASTPKTENSKTKQNVQDKSLYYIEDVALPGSYSLNCNITISEAIKKAGGLRNCDTCFQDRGEEYLWATFAGAKIERNNSTYRVKKHELDAWPIQPGDKIHLLHYMW